MTPSPLKKMRGQKGRAEGIYASSDLHQSRDLSLNSDLGLTLFPGPQTPKEDEDRGHVPSERRTISSGYLLSNGKQQGLNELWAACGPATGDVDGKEQRLDDYLHVQNGKRRKLQGDQMLQPVQSARSQGSIPVGACKASKLVGKFNRNFQLQPIRTQRKAGEALLFEEEYAKKLPINSGIEHASVSANRLFPEESYKNSSLFSDSVLRPASRSTSCTLNATEESLTAIAAVSALNSLLEFENRRDPKIFLLDSNCQNVAKESIQSCSDGVTSHRPVIIERRPRARVLNSWTSHFPKASKRSEAINHARHSSPPSMTTPSPSPLLPTIHQYKDKHIHQLEHTKEENPTPSTIQNQSSPPSKKSLRSKQPALWFGSRDPDFLLKSSLERAASFPIMSWPSRPTPSSSPPIVWHPVPLPTPAYEARSRNFHQQFTDPYSTPTKTSLTGSILAENEPETSILSTPPHTPGTTPANQIHNDFHQHHPVQGNSYFRAGSMAYDPEFLQQTVNRSEPPQSSSNRKVLNNEVETSLRRHSDTQVFRGRNFMPLNLQQRHNGEALRQTLPHGSEEGEVLFGHGPYQLLHSSSEQRWEAAPNQLHDYRNITKMYEDKMRDLHSQNANLVQQYKVIQQENASLRRNASIIHRKQREASEQLQRLTTENAELRKRHQFLAFELNKLTSKPRSDALIANDILQHLGSGVASNPHCAGSGRITSAPSYNHQTCLSGNASTNLHSSLPNGTSQTATSSYIKTRVPASSSACIDLEDTSRTCITTPLCENPSGIPSLEDQVASTGFQSLQSDAGSKNAANNSSEKITIDLTDDFSPSTGNCGATEPTAPDETPKNQSSPVDPAENLQSQADFMQKFSKKDLGWLQGHHPGRIGKSGVNFGLPSKITNPNIEKTREKIAVTPKRVHQVVPALIQVQKQDSETGKAVEKKRKRADYSEESNQKKKAKVKQVKQSAQTSQASSSVSGYVKQSRKSAKIQKRQVSSHEPQAEARSQIRQESLGSKSLEESARDQQSIINRSDMSADSEMENESVEDQDGQEVSVRGTEIMPDAERMGEDDENAAFAAEWEAVMMAQAEAEEQQSDGGSTPVENDVSAGSNANSSSIAGEISCSRESESEESEEE